jgi:lipoyl-dependent peroxiredoxin
MGKSTSSLIVRLKWAVKGMALTRSNYLAGYAACFIGALRVVAGKRHIRVPEDVSIDSAVSFGPLAGGVVGFGIAVSMIIHLPGIERAIAEELAHLAHQTCPYSNATRGNIDVLLTLG